MNPTVAALVALDEAITALFVEEGVIRVQALPTLFQAGKQCLDIAGAPAITCLTDEAQIILMQVTLYAVRIEHLSVLSSGTAYLWQHRERFHALVQLLRERDEKVELP